MFKLSKYWLFCLLLTQSLVVSAETNASKKGYAGITAAYGYETNPLSAGTEVPTNQSDNYFELLGYGYLPITNKIYLNGKIYVRDFKDQDTVDLGVYSAGLDYRARLANWKITPSVSFVRITYGGDDYQSIGRFDLRFDKKISSNSKFRMLYEYSDITPENDLYYYLEGKRNRFRFEYKVKTVVGKLRLRYQLDLNDRLDKFNNGSTTPDADYSPTRNSISARLRQTIAGWNFTANAEFRNSEYDPTRDNGFVREDERLKLGFDISRNFSKEWKAGFLYGYTDNESNDPNKNYDTSDYQVYLEWLF